MPQSPTYNYKQEQHRYRYYFTRLSRFYQKPVAQVSTALLLTIFTIIFFAAFAIRPTLITIAELLKTIDDQKDVLAQLERKSTALAVVQSEYSLIQSDLPKLDAAVPSDYQVSQLLRYIEATAFALNVPVTNVRVKDITYPLEQDEGKIQELPVTMSIEATYPELQTALDNLSRLPRFLSINSIGYAKPVSLDESQNTALRLIIDATAYYVN